MQDRSTKLDTAEKSVRRLSRKDGTFYLGKNGKGWVSPLEVFALCLGDFIAQDIAGSMEMLLRRRNWGRAFGLNEERLALEVEHRCPGLLEAVEEDRALRHGKPDKTPIAGLFYNRVWCFYYPDKHKGSWPKLSTRHPMVSSLRIPVWHALIDSQPRGKTFTLAEAEKIGSAR